MHTLGYEPRELIGTPAVDLNHPEESPEVVELHWCVSSCRESPDR